MLSPNQEFARPRTEDPVFFLLGIIHHTQLKISQVLPTDLLVDGTSSSKWVGEPDDYRGPGWLEEQGTSGREAICGLSICLTADCSGTQLMDVHVGAV